MDARTHVDGWRCLALLLPFLVAACGERGSAANDVTCPNEAPWATGELDKFELAVARSRDRAVPLLVLIRPAHIKCPPADRLEGILRGTPGLEERCVLVVTDGGTTAGEDERDLVRRGRLGASMPPLLVVAGPDLEVLHVQVSGLMPYYDLDGQPMPQAPGQLLTGQDVLALLERVQASLKTTDERLASLGAPTTPEGELERVALLVSRGRWDAARSAAAGVDPRTLSMKEARRLFDLLMATGAREQARTLADRVLAQQPQAKGAGWLELGLMWHFEQDLDGLGLQRLGLLIDTAKQAGCQALEIALRAVRVSVLSKTRPSVGSPLAEDLRLARAAGRELFAAHIHDGPRVLALLAEAAIRRSDFKEAQRLIVLLDGDYPESGEAVRFRHMTLDKIQRRAEGLQPLSGPDRPRPEPPQAPR